MAGRLSDMNLPRFPLLSNDEVQALLKQAKAGDDAARERLINCNLRLVFNLIQRFAGRGCEMEDLFQIGTIGLMKAIDKFDTTYDVRFSTYAVPLIIGEIRRHLRDDGLIKISRYHKKLGMELKIHDVEFGSIIAGVQSGKFDMGIAGLTVTDERKEKVNFSESYAKGVQVVIVKEDSEYASFEDFYTEIKDDTPQGVKEGIKIGVQQDTTGDIYSSDTPENWGFGGDNVIRYKTGADAVQALISGKVTAVIIDNEPAKSFVEGNKGLKIMDATYVEEDYYKKVV